MATPDARHSRTCRAINQNTKIGRASARDKRWIPSELLSSGIQAFRLALGNNPMKTRVYCKRYALYNFMFYLVQYIPYIRVAVVALVESTAAAAVAAIVVRTYYQFLADVLRCAICAQSSPANV